MVVDAQELAARARVMAFRRALGEADEQPANTRKELAEPGRVLAEDATAAILAAPG